jgi:predicted SAM-dependent methyltransferase
VILSLFSDAGFVDCVIQPAGERNTDMGIEGTKILEGSLRDIIHGEAELTEKGAEIMLAGYPVKVADSISQYGKPDFGEYAEPSAVEASTIPHSKRYVKKGEDGKFWHSDSPWGPYELVDEPQLVQKEEHIVTDLPTEQELTAAGVPFSVDHASSKEAAEAAERLGIAKVELEKPAAPSTTLVGFPVVVSPNLKKPTESDLGSPSNPIILGCLESQLPREEMFDKHYFNGGGKVGGYAREGYWDYPVHEVTARHVLARKPQSVLELGCARGYIGKRIQDAGVRWNGLEVSKHCYMTRVADGIHLFDLCKTTDISKSSKGTWPFASHVVSAADPRINQLHPFDLCFSIATLEHVPERFLPAVLSEISRCCKRSLHGIDFGVNDDGFDKTHTTLKPKQWWQEQFRKYAPSHRAEIVDKEELERGPFPPDVLNGDGKVKLNVGSFTTMYHHGWTNIDVHDLGGFAAQHGYNYLRRDVREGLPYKTGEVSLVMLCHFLEHLTYEEGKTFLRECRRVLKPEGCMRIIVPDTAYLIDLYAADGTSGAWASDCKSLSDFDEINDGCANCPTEAAKLWMLLHEGHSACYDVETLSTLLMECGFVAQPSSFRNARSDSSAEMQVRRETLDLLPCLSLYMNAIPRLG